VYGNCPGHPIRSNPGYAAASSSVAGPYTASVGSPLIVVVSRSVFRAAS
jgi:hypothetical protein